MKKSKIKRAKAKSATVDKQIRLQQEQDHKDKKAKKAKPASAEASPTPLPHTGHGEPQPAPPMPAQHLKKPGLETEMALKPRFMAPHYKGSGKLDGFSTIVTGGDSGIGRAAQPEELSPAYVFLAAPCCSSYITGIVLPITGTAGDGA